MTQRQIVARPKAQCCLSVVGNVKHSVRIRHIQRVRLPGGLDVELGAGLGGVGADDESAVHRLVKAANVCAVRFEYNVVGAASLQIYIAGIGLEQRRDSSPLAAEYVIGSTVVPDPDVVACPKAKSTRGVV